MAAVIENRLGSYEKRKEQVRRYELFIETNNSTGDTNKKPRLEIESKKSKYKIRFPDGCVFLAACSSGSTEDVAELLKNPNTDINTTNVDGLTGLHQACINEDIDMVKFLVDKGIDVNMRDNEGWTALHAAAQSGFIEIAKFLIARGARLDLINCDCELPLDLSQTKSMTQLLEETMKDQGIDGNKARNAEERMMMEDIGKWSHSGIYEGAVDDRTGATPLHVAAVKGYQEIMKHLIQLGAPVDAVDNEGWTPMHGAAHWGQEEACRLLAENYCDLRAVNHQGNTPLDVADPNVVGLLEELLEKQKSLPENSNVSRPSNKIRKSSITRISAGQMKDLQRKNEEDEKPPMMPNLPVSEDDDSFGDSDQNKTVAKVRPIEEEGQTGDGQVAIQVEADKFQDREFEGMKPDVKAPAATERSDNKPEEVLSEDRIQFLLEERKKKLGQQRASDSNVVIMRREVPRPKCNSEYLFQISRPRLIASDLMRRSGDPSLWRLAYRRSSNSENDIDVEGVIELSDEQIKKESGETDEDKELRRSGEQSPDNPHHQQLEPIKEFELPSNQQSSLLRPETAAALASIASSHQRLTDNSKRDDANELERKLKAKRARESRRSTQGVTKEDIQRAEDTLKAAYQGQSKINPLSADTSTVPYPKGGSGDVDSGQNFSVPHVHPASESQGGGMIDSSVATIIEKWQKKDGEVVIKGDPRAPVGSRGSVLGSPALHSKDYSPETLILYRKISEQLQDNPQRESSNQQVPAQFSDTQSKEGETGEDPVVKMAASRSRRKRESRRSTGKISLEGADIQLSDTEEADDLEQMPLQMTTETSCSATSMPTSHPEIYSVSSLPKAVPSTTSLPLTSTSNTVGRFSSSRFNPDPTSISPVKISNIPGRDRWSTFSSSWQQQPSPIVRSSAILSSYDSLSSGQNFRTGSTGTNSAILSVDYQKLWEQEKLENESLKKRNEQLERDLRNAQLQIDVSAPSKGFDRPDSREKRSSERKLAEVQEEKKLLEAKLASLDEELKKVESLKIENTKLKNENAALIRVISKLSK